MGKIMGNLKHTYNAFPQLQTKFFHTQYVIWSFPLSFTEFHHNVHILQISGTILEKLTMMKKLQPEASPTKLFQI